MAILTTRIINDKNQWEQFSLSNNHANFLNSWNWGSFHQNLGKQIFRYGFVQDNSITATALFIKETAKRANYLTIAGGPLINWQNTIHLKLFSQLARRLAKEQNCSFLRIRPQIDDTAANRALVKELRFVPSPMHLTADTTIELDITKSPEQLLAQMRKSTRYEIKKSQKLGITVTTSSNPDDLKEFDHHQQALAKKHNFVPFSHDYLSAQFKAFVPDNQVLLFHSNLNNHLLASAFVIFYNKQAIYHYGISTKHNAKLPGSYACQWAAILEAQKRNCTSYNFWGVAPQNSHPTHRFSGVTLFKSGFGGNLHNYLPAHDLPISTNYHLVKLFEKIRSKTRHLS